jgi:hypothetical protein
MAKLFVISSFILSISLISTSAFTSGGNMENGGMSHVGSTLVITGQSAVPARYCNRIFGQYEAVMIDLEGKETMLTNIGIPAGMSVDPGSRFKVVAQNPCGGNRLNLDFEKK